MDAETEVEVSDWEKREQQIADLTRRCQTALANNPGFREKVLATFMERGDLQQRTWFMLQISGQEINVSYGKHCRETAGGVGTTGLFDTIIWLQIRNPQGETEWIEFYDKGKERRFPVSGDESRIVVSFPEATGKDDQSHKNDPAAYAEAQRIIDLLSEDSVGPEAPSEAKNA